MRIHVGSKNITKLAAVRETVRLYPKLFPSPEVVGIDVAVEQFGHPKNMDETVAGAVERAKRAFLGSTYSIGLEGGLMKVPHTASGYLEVGACAVYDGKLFHIGFSPAFEFPSKVVKMILESEGGCDASEAFKRLGLTNEEKIGNVPGGIIGMLTDGRMSREDFSKYSIMMALVQLENSNLYR